MGASKKKKKKKEKINLQGKNSEYKLMVTLAEIIFALQHLHIWIHMGVSGYLGFYTSISYCKSEKTMEALYDSEMHPWGFWTHKVIYALQTGINICFQRRTPRILPSHEDWTKFRRYPGLWNISLWPSYLQKVTGLSIPAACRSHWL